MCVARPTFFLAVILSGLLLCPQISEATDADGNGFDDALEQILARRFCPSFRLQEGQHVRPMPVGIIGTSNSFTSVPGNAVWLKLYSDATGQVIGAWRADDPGWPTWWHDQGWGAPDWDYSWVHDLTQMWYPPDKAPGIYTAKFYLDWGGPSTDAPSDWGPFYLSSDGNSYGHPGRYYKSTAYAHLFCADSLTVIQYWFFYPYNDWVNNHEGDWEHINVVISSADPEQSVIEMVEYYFHNRYLSADPALGQLYQVDETHPVVFVGGYGEMYCGGMFIGSGPQGGGSYPVLGHWERAGSPVEIEVAGVQISCPAAADDLSTTGDYVHWSNVQVIVWPDADAEYCAAHPDRSWMKALMPWGTTFASSPGDWLGAGSVGNDAPPTPSRTSEWEHLGPETSRSLYVRNRPYDPVTDSDWIAPSPPAAPAIAVDRPNGGETWHIGDEQTIIWHTDSPAVVDSVDVLLSLDGGSTFPVTISEYHDDIWSLPWTVGPAPASQCKIKAIAHVADGGVAEDVSDAPFAITYASPPPPPPPTGGGGGGCPFVSAWNGHHFGGHNTVLNPFGTEESGPDRIDYLLFEKARPKAGVWEIEVSEFEGDSVFIDGVRVYQVCAPAEYDGLVCSKGTVMGFKRIDDLGLVGGWSNADPGGSARAVPKDCLDGTPGTTALFLSAQRLTGEMIGDPYIVIVGRDKPEMPLPPGYPLSGSQGMRPLEQPVGVGVSIVTGAEAASTPLGTFVPRENPYPSIVGPIPMFVPVDSTLIASLDFRGRHRISQISVVRASEVGVSADECSLVCARLADGTDVTERVAEPDSRYANLISSGHIRLSFREAAGKSRPIRGLLVEIRGHYITGSRDTKGEADAITRATRIISAGPNPSSGEITVSYEARPSERVEIGVFDVRGRLVRELPNGVALSGIQTVTWDGRDSAGEAVSSGVYFVRLSGGHCVSFRKVLLCR
ncbi:MAG: FlgD immunoglobulin-like domain containing protein [Candidatus Eisenbacteria bacterium]